ncbi:C-CAP/cofactor C-like domain-containing protein, partial [Meloidogyne graminicola]
MKTSNYVVISDEHSKLFGYRILNSQLSFYLGLIQLFICIWAFSQHIWAIFTLNQILHCDFSDNSTLPPLFTRVDAIIYDIGLFHNLWGITGCVAQHLDGGYGRFCWCIAHIFALIICLPFAFCSRPRPYCLWPLLIQQSAYGVGMLILSLAAFPKAAQLIGDLQNAPLRPISFYIFGTLLNFFLLYVYWHWYWHVETLWNSARKLKRGETLNSNVHLDVHHHSSSTISTTSTTAQLLISELNKKPYLKKYYSSLSSSNSLPPISSSNLINNKLIQNNNYKQQQNIQLPPRVLYLRKQEHFGQLKNKNLLKEKNRRSSSNCELIENKKLNNFKKLSIQNGQIYLNEEQKRNKILTQQIISLKNNNQINYNNKITPLLTSRCSLPLIEQPQFNNNQKILFFNNQINSKNDYFNYLENDKEFLENSVWNFRENKNLNFCLGEETWQRLKNN